VGVKLGIDKNNTFHFILAAKLYEPQFWAVCKR